MKPLSQKIAWILLTIGCFVKLFLVVQDFSQPLTHRTGGDVEAWPNMAYYFYHNLNFFPWPQLTLVSDEMLYPFGNNHVFQDLTLEFNYFYSLFYHFFGPFGPWASLYYAFCTFLGVFFSFWLLKREYSVSLAFAITFLAFFFDFYSIFKFSGHLVHAVHHWLTWSILTDLILYHRLIKGKPISFSFLLLKSLVLLGSLGQEVAYLTGFALLSTLIFFVSAVGFIALDPNLRSRWSRIESYWACFRWTKSQRLTVFSLIFFNIVLIWAYLPLVFQVLANVALFEGEPSPSAYSWAHPLKLFLPLIGRADLVGLPSILHYFKDRPEFFWDYLIGWTLSGLLIFSFFYLIRKKQIGFALPIFIILGFCLLFHPTVFPTLHVFSWFTFNRNSGRSTIIFSTLIPLLLVFLPLRSMSNRSFPWVTVWFLIGVSEIISVYAIRFSDKAYGFDKKLNSYVTTVRNTPGKAIFDFPFCIIGGNGIGFEENLCPCYLETSNQGFMAYFHQKHTVSYYYGRMYPSMLQPFVENGWDQLMVAEKKERQPNKLSECPTESIFQQMERIIQLGDFAGLQIYEDLLPNAACMAKFVEHFGQPISSTPFPGGGLIHFIPKKEEWLPLMNESELKTLKIRP